MKFIKTEQTAKGLAVTYRNDADEVADEQYANFREGGHYVDDVPPQEDNGMNYQLMYDPDTNTTYYLYTTPPPKPQDEIAVLRQQLDDLTLAVADMMGGAI